MHVEVKNRDWVKNAAIIFLSIMLVLTFFSNTIMNRSLPEVSTQEATSGSIVAKVRGTGTVVANGSYQEKAKETREIRAVLIKEGQQINAGDPMFVLGEGNSEELEELQEQLRSLNVSYQRSSISVPTFDYTLENSKIEDAEEELAKAEKALKEIESSMSEEETQGNNRIEETRTKLDAAKKKLAELEVEADAAKKLLEEKVKAAKKALADAEENSDDIEELSNTENTGDGGGTEPPEENTEPLLSPVEQARKDLEKAQLDLVQFSYQPYELQKKLVDAYESELVTLSNSAGINSQAYLNAIEAKKDAEDELATLRYQLEQKRISDNKSQQLAYLDLGEVGNQIAKVKEKISELSGGEENQILAKVSGTVQTVECMAGNTAEAGSVLCTIEVPDMGYNLSFSVTNEQARRLKPGDSATVSNFYWGSEIVATLSTIKTDPKSPMTNKLLTFDLTGDVTAGGELSISVGQKSAGYDIVVPNSSIKSDTNGSFVYVIEAKNSPLGNRYTARRASVEVLASDDNNSAVTGDIENGDYVITISNAPIKNGDLIRMADS